MALLGGLFMVLYAIRLVVQKSRIMKNGIAISGRVMGFTGKHTTYRFTHDGKTISANSLQRTPADPKRISTMEDVYFDPKAPQYVVIAKNRGVELNALFMALVGLLATAGGVIGLLYY